MSYKLSVDAFDKTFAVNETGTKLTHFSGKRFKLFPFVANNTSTTVNDLSSVVGRYINQIDGREADTLRIDDLVEALKDGTTIESGQGEMFYQVVRHMFFDRDSRIRPINLKMISLIPCEDSNARKVADYLVDVLGDNAVLRTSIQNAYNKLDDQANVLEKFVISKLHYKAIPQENRQPYQRITNAVKKQFEEDFEYVLASRIRTRDYLTTLLEFYYFTYTAQTILQLNRFLAGDRVSCVPLYFCLDWEKTSQNRRCYTEGWSSLQDGLRKIFAHAIVLEILNQTETGCEQIDYIRLRELVQTAEGEDHRIAQEIRALTDRYRNAIQDCVEMREYERVSSADGETAAEVSFLFHSVRLQFENSFRNRPYTAYADKFSSYCNKYLKPRGRSGLMLNLTEETVIFLTKICIKDQEKMRLNDVFLEFEARGVFLDNISKEQIMHYYEKLNLIEKKSDSGDAQYVKRIL